MIKTIDSLEADEVLHKDQAGAATQRAKPFKNTEPLYSFLRLKNRYSQDLQQPLSIESRYKLEEANGQRSPRLLSIISLQKASDDQTSSPKVKRVVLSKTKREAKLNQPRLKLYLPSKYAVGRSRPVNDDGDSTPGGRGQVSPKLLEQTMYVSPWRQPVHKTGYHEYTASIMHSLNKMNQNSKSRVQPMKVERAVQDSFDHYVVASPDFNL